MRSRSVAIAWCALLLAACERTAPEPSVATSPDDDAPNGVVSPAAVADVSRPAPPSPPPERDPKNTVDRLRFEVLLLETDVKSLSRYVGMPGTSRLVDLVDGKIERLEQESAEAWRRVTDPSLRRLLLSDVLQPFSEIRRAWEAGLTEPERQRPIVDRLRFKVELLRADVEQEALFSEAESRYVAMPGISQPVGWKVERLAQDIVQASRRVTDPSLRRLLLSDVVHPFAEIRREWEAGLAARERQ